jgi:hypothetical protein
MLKFFSDPVAYQPGDKFLEMGDLRLEVKEICEKLFPENEVPQSEDQTEAVDDEPSQPGFDGLSYEQKIARQFESDLNQIGALSPQAKSQLQHIDEEIALAAKTGELTIKLRNLSKGLLSIPAASIESERAFSVASRYVTKIRSRLSDTTLDNFCFAKCKLKNDKLVIIIAISLTFHIIWEGGNFF